MGASGHQQRVEENVARAASPCHVFFNRLLELHVAPERMVHVYVVLEELIADDPDADSAQFWAEVLDLLLD